MLCLINPLREAPEMWGGSHMERACELCGLVVEASRKAGPMRKLEERQGLEEGCRGPGRSLVDRR